MTIREFLASYTDDIDVYNNITDENGVAYCGTHLTSEGEREFAEVLDYEIEVDTEDDVANVICDDDASVSWQHKAKAAMDMFWSMAGYCNVYDWDKWFYN